MWGQILCDLVLLPHHHRRHAGYVLMTFPHELSSHTCVYNKQIIIMHRIFFTLPQNFNTQTYACTLLELVLLRLLLLDNFSFSRIFLLQTLTVGDSGFVGLGVSVQAFSTQVRGFKPGRSRRIFKGEKILSTPSFRGEVKLSVPRQRFAACKKSLNVAWKSRFRQNYMIFLAYRVPPSATRGLSRCVDMGGHLVTEVGTSKLGGTQGCTISL